MKLRSSEGRRWAFFKKYEIFRHDDFAMEEVYLRRWRLIESPYFGVKIHHIILSDADTLGYHDHPWDFISFRLWGNYSERRLDARDHEFRSRSTFFVVRRAEDLHLVEVDREGKGAWRLVINGPRRRQWGFRYKGGPWRDQMMVNRPNNVIEEGE